MEPNETKTQNDMKRRDLLKVLSAMPAAALLPGAASAATGMTMPAAPAPAADQAYKPSTLDPHEYKMVQVLGDIIIPADERSGNASQAGVPEFIDDWLGFSGGNTLSAIRGGIVWLDMECNRAHGHDFLDCTDAEKKAILDRIAYPKTAAPEDAAGVVFFNQMRNLVLSGFYSSKMGVADLPYLGNKMLSEWNGCPPEVLARLGFGPGAKQE